MMRSANQEARVLSGLPTGRQSFLRRGEENYQPGVKVTNKRKVSGPISIFLANHFVSLNLCFFLYKQGSYEFPLSV